MKIKTETLIRTAVTFFVLINSVLVILGKDKLPWTEDEVYAAVSAVAAAVTTLWSWWKNNSISAAAIKADEYMDSLKSEGKV